SHVDVKNSCPFSAVPDRPLKWRPLLRGRSFGRFRHRRLRNSVEPGRAWLRAKSSGRTSTQCHKATQKRTRSPSSLCSCCEEAFRWRGSRTKILEHPNARMEVRANERNGLESGAGGAVARRVPAAGGPPA